MSYSRLLLGMVFNPADGLLKKLTVDFEKRIGSLNHIYSLISRDSFKNTDGTEVKK